MSQVANSNENVRKAAPTEAGINPTRRFLAQVCVDFRLIGAQYVIKHVPIFNFRVSVCGDDHKKYATN